MHFWYVETINIESPKSDGLLLISSSLKSELDNLQVNLRRVKKAESEDGEEAEEEDELQPTSGKNKGGGLIVCSLY